VHSNWSPRPFRSLGVSLVRQTRRIQIADNKDKEGRSGPGAAIGQVCGAVVEKRDDIGAAMRKIATSNDQSVLCLMYISGNAVTVHEYLRMRIAPVPYRVAFGGGIDHWESKKSNENGANDHQVLH